MKVKHTMMSDQMQIQMQELVTILWLCEISFFLSFGESSICNYSEITFCGWLSYSTK